MAVVKRRSLFKFLLQSSKPGRNTNTLGRYLHDSSTHGADPAKIRNLGILAHIDAGKTTTTERMLFYSGKISSMGEVHEGNTVTDYMEQERNRGITITSASVSFLWKDFFFNLVDTPGHIDFTMEVEQTLSVLDGAIVILDASAGVEAQTQTVWRQADHYKIPRIAYANKMDRHDASLNLCKETLEEKLSAHVLVTQLPVYEGKEFNGVVDLINMKKLIWQQNSFGGSKFTTTSLEESSEAALWEEASRARELLVDELSGLDDLLAEKVIAEESLESVSTKDISAALRRCTILQKGVPLLCGSSYKNKGVQALMDAVIRFLPSPLERSNLLFSNVFKERLCAQAFKVIHHRQMGPLVFFRIYSGCIKKNQRFFNMRRGLPEPCTRVYIATADDFEEVDSVGLGNIAVVAGLKETRPGDLVTNSDHSASLAYETVAKSYNVSKQDAEKFLYERNNVPEPVFFCSVEAPSQGQQVALENALTMLQREDPSLSVSFNEETSQLILGGMGELHLDIIKERLQSEYKLDVLIGRMHIAYREMLKNPVHEDFASNHIIGSSKQHVEISMSVIPKASDCKKDVLQISSSDRDTQARLQSLPLATVKALRQGVRQGLSYGPKLNCPLIDAFVHINNVLIGKGTSLSMVSSATSHCVREALKNADTGLMEPVMLVEVVTTEEHFPIVTADLSRRRGLVLSSDIRSKMRVVRAKVPLAELLGYSSDLRIMSSGNASFSMEFSEYQCLSTDQEILVIRRETGMLS